VTANSPAPIRVLGVEHAVAIAAGSAHSLALEADGTVWAWGRNDSGQLGSGQRGDRHRPVRVDTLDGVTAIAAGASHSLALKADGTVWAWGWNAHGQLGDGTVAASHPSPVRVSGLEHVVAIAAGGYLDALFATIGHSLALRRDGTVWAWGWNKLGQLGDGGGDDRRVPVPVAGLRGVTAIAAGGSHSLALAAPTIWLADGSAAPPRLTLRAEQSVTWTNAGGERHDLVADDGRWGSGPPGPGQGYSRALAAPGAYPYHCTIHPDLQGVVSVTTSKSAVTRVEETSPALVYTGKWRRRSENRASGETTTYSDESEPGEVSYQWVGTDVSVLMTRGPNLGMASITVDDDGYLVDLYNPNPQFQQPVLDLEDLPTGPHLLTIAPANQRNARSSGGSVALDAIETR
jgi:hypothetical protein